MKASNVAKRIPEAVPLTLHHEHVIRQLEVDSNLELRSFRLLRLTHINLFYRLFSIPHLIVGDFFDVGKDVLIGQVIERIQYLIENRKLADGEGYSFFDLIGTSDRSRCHQRHHLVILEIFSCQKIDDPLHTKDHQSWLVRLEPLLR